MDAEKIARKARKSISKFCMEECHAYCCRKGYLVIEEAELYAVTRGKQKELEGNSSLKKMLNGKYSLYMDDFSCPSLLDNKCMIHTSKNRPNTCLMFPLFIEGNNIKLSPRCPAVKIGMFYPYIARLLKMGFTLCKDSSVFEIEAERIIFN